MTSAATDITDLSANKPLTKQPTKLKKRLLDEDIIASTFASYKKQTLSKSVTTQLCTSFHSCHCRLTPSTVSSVQALIFYFCQVSAYPNESDDKMLCSSCLGAIYTPLRHVVNIHYFWVYKSKNESEYNKKMNANDVNVKKLVQVLGSRAIEYVDSVIGKVYSIQKQIVGSVVPCQLRNRVGNGLYIGEGVDQKPHGKGILYNLDGTRFDGDFVHGQRHGQGKEYIGEVLKFKGTWCNDKKNGTGILYQKDGTVLECMFRDGIANGEGKVIFSGNGRIKTIKGRWNSGNFNHLKVFLEYTDGGKYDGSVHERDKSMRHGTGTMTFANGAVYKGGYDSDKRHGKGEMSYPDGKVKFGTFAKGVFVDGLVLSNTSSAPIHYRAPLAPGAPACS